MPKYFDIHSHLNSSAYQKDFDEVIKRLKETETHTMVVGTDFESSKKAVDLADKNIDYDRQKKLFLDQVKFALVHNKPIMIHARNAYEELLEILEPLKEIKLPLGSLASKLRGNVHFFAGNVEVAKRFFEIGFTVSFTGVITFVRDYDEVIKSTPLNMIMSETDSPYVTPTPYRGKRNEPSYVSEVVKKIAEIREENDKIVGDTLVSNALSMIG